jgi:hypothetical protein
MESGGVIDKNGTMKVSPMNTIEVSTGFLVFFLVEQPKV